MTLAFRWLACALALLALTAPAASAAGWRPPPANAKFDYQIGEPYSPRAGVRVVSRDWFAARRGRLGAATRSVTSTHSRRRTTRPGCSGPTSARHGRRIWCSASWATIRTGAGST